MIDLVVLVLLIIHELFELFAEQMHLAQVKGSEIRKKRLIHQVIIDAEVERVLARLRWILVANPIETTRNDLDRLIAVTFSGSRGSSFRSGLYHFLS